MMRTKFWYYCTSQIMYLQSFARPLNVRADRLLLTSADLLWLCLVESLVGTSPVNMMTMAVAAIYFHFTYQDIDYSKLF